MIALWPILKSYFKQPFWLLLMVAIVGMVLGVTSGMSSPHKALLFFVLMPTSWMPVVGLHLRHLTLWQQGVTAPGYYQYQLVVALLILSFISIFPAVAISLSGHPPWLTLFWTLLIFTSCFLAGYFLDKVAVILAPILMVSMLLHDAFELGPRWFDATRQPTLLHFSGIGLCLLTITLFSFHYLKDCGRNLRQNGVPLMGFDLKIGLFPFRFLANRRLRSFLSASSPSRLRFLKLAQFSLFSPGFISFTLPIILLLFSGTLKAMVEWKLRQAGSSIRVELLENVSGIMLIGFGMMIVMISTNFLQHRNRLPMLWLQAQNSQRSDFFRDVAAAYLLVVFRQFGLMTLGWIFLTFWLKLDLVIVSVTLVYGILLQILIVGLSLLFAWRIKTLSASAWSMGWGFLFGACGVGGGFFLKALASQPDFQPVPMIWHLPLLCLLSGISLFWGMSAWRDGELETITRRDGLEEMCM